MNAPGRPRHHLLAGKRISTITRANPADLTTLEREGRERHDEWKTLLILFTDGTTARIEAFGDDDGSATLEVEVDGD